MREFGEPADRHKLTEIMALAQSFFDGAPKRRALTAKEFALEEDADRVMVHEADVRNGEERLRVAVTREDARPPFEWLMEITSDVGESDYFKHYLVTEEGVFLAQRKVLTPVDEAEAQIILSDQKIALGWL